MLPTLQAKIEAFENEEHFQRSTKAKFPFQNNPPGSEWKRPHLEWLNIWFRPRFNAAYLFTENSRLHESSQLSRYLELNLNLSWQRITEETHPLGSIYDHLAVLASHVAPRPKYKEDHAPLSSSPTGSESSDAPPPLNLTYMSHGMTTHHFTAPAKSAPTPSKPPSIRQDGSTLQQAVGQSKLLLAAVSCKNHAHKLSVGTSGAEPEDFLQDVSSSPRTEPLPSPSRPPVKGNQGSNPDTKLEKDVEVTVSAFLAVIGNALKATEPGMTESRKIKQNLTMAIL